MNVKELKEMINLMTENNLVELEVEKDGYKLRLKRGIAGFETKEEYAAQPHIITQPIVQAASAQEAKAAPAEIYHVVKSPMVGTFYAAPAPDQEPYVKAGQAVKEDDVLCIIEAMKLMNEIKSEVSGKIVEVLVENGQPVEFDQPLFKIDTKST
ncbi:MAG: acetyl-CoA carboxylase biotin carboxyl carrier protein [Candidatus Omnitrophica bacterium]|nr:acetyl-CoA carboxylase biotin carboxyl carrier protein [Candidatus Omnitrophota bacterium]